MYLRNNHTQPCANHTPARRNHTPALIRHALALVAFFALTFLATAGSAFATSPTITYKSGDATGSDVVITDAAVEERLYSILLADPSDSAFSDWTAPTITENSVSYEGAFAGWKLTKVNGSAVSGTYFYPDNDYIYYNDEPFATKINSALPTSLEFEALWGKTVYLRDEYNFNDLGLVFGSNVATAQIDWDTSTTYSSDSWAGNTSSTPVASLEKAQELVGADGGKIVIVNHYTLQAETGTTSGDYPTTNNAKPAYVYESGYTNTTKTFYTYVGHYLENGVLTISGAGQGMYSSGEGKSADTASYYTNSSLYILNTRGNGVYGTSTVYATLTMQMRVTGDVVFEDFNSVCYRESYNTSGSRATADYTIYVATNKHFLMESTYIPYKRNTTGGTASKNTQNWLHKKNSASDSALSLGGSTAVNVYGHYYHSVHAPVYGANYDNIYLTLRPYSLYSVQANNGNISNGLNNVHLAVENCSTSSVYVTQKSTTITSATVLLDNVSATQFSPIYGVTATITSLNIVSKYSDTNQTSRKITSFYLGGYTTSTTERTATLTNANVYVDGGTITSFYGGGNSVAYTVLGDLNITVNGGTVNALYGGGLGGFVGSTTTPASIDLTVNGGTIGKLFGGGAGGIATLTTSNSTTGSNITAYDIDATTGRPNYLVYNNTPLYSIQSTSNSATKNAMYELFTTTTSAGGTYQTLKTTSAYLQNGTNYLNIGNYYRSYNSYAISDAVVNADITINVNGGTINSDIYGGGENGAVNGDITINVTSATSFKNDIYGGGQGTATEFTATYYGTDFKFSGTTGNTPATFEAAARTAGTTYSNGDTFYSTQSATVYNNYLNTPWLTSTDIENLDLLDDDGYYVIYSPSILDLGKVNGDITINLDANTSSNNAKSDIYGGSNGALASVTGDIEINMTSKNRVNNVYGGGNAASVTGNISINGSGSSRIYGDLYGGGNAAPVTGNTSINLSTFVAYGDIYGGGNAATVSGNTFTVIRTVTAYSSVYGGGNSAAVLGNATTVLNGNGTVSGSVFGGGNSAPIGSASTNNSAANVYIAGSTVNGNVYGGCNTSVIYGTAAITIGDSLFPSGITAVNNPVKIKGNIYGGGEANASGSSDYDFSFISVTQGTTIAIDGTGYSVLWFQLLGSVFGSGNASSTLGTSTISINHVGDTAKIMPMVSLQRADSITIQNSYINLTGTIDSTNRHATELFTISRVGELTLKDATILLENGTNLLENFTSRTTSGAIATTSNAENRVYIAAGKNMKVTTAEDASTFGEVTGMTYLGIYDPGTLALDYSSASNAATDETLDATAIDMSIYHYNSTYCSTSSTLSGVYALGALVDDYETDGFYTNYDDCNTTDYISPVTAGLSHIWRVGSNATVVNLTLIASSYSTLGKYSLTDLVATAPQTTYNLTNIDYSGLASGVSVIDSNNIPIEAASSSAANSNIGLHIDFEANNYWDDNYSIDLRSDLSAGYTGDTDFITEYITATPKISIYLTNSANLTRADSYGTISLTFEGMKQVDELNKEFYEIIVNITIDPTTETSTEYEAAITTGQRYTVFGNTSANISRDSSVTISYDLTSAQNLYSTTSDLTRTFISDYVLPAGTVLTLIDNSDKTAPKFYSYTVTAADVSAGKHTYLASDFTLIGNTSTHYDNTQSYYHTYYHEQLFVQIDFSRTTTNTYDTDHYLHLELGSTNSSTRTTINDSTINRIIYTVTDDVPEYSFDGSSLESSEILPDESLEISVLATRSAEAYTETKDDDKLFYLRAALEMQSGDTYIHIPASTLFNRSFTAETSASAIYADSLGYFYSLINNTNSNTLREYILNNYGMNMPAGNYRLHLDLVTTYSTHAYTELLVEDHLNFTIADTSYGLSAEIASTNRVHQLSTALDLANNSDLSLTVTTETGNLTSPILKFKFEKLNGSTYLPLTLSNTFTNSYTATSGEYTIATNPAASIPLTFTYANTATAGAYRLVFELYDGTTLVGEYPVQFLIK